MTTTIKKTLEFKAEELNFRRLTGVSLEDYHMRLHEQGCRFAYLYFDNIPNPGIRKEYAYEMTQVPAYWHWWKNQFNNRVKQAFGDVEVHPTEPFIEQQAKEALIESWYYNTNAICFLNICPPSEIHKTIRKNYDSRKNTTHECAYAGLPAAPARKRNRPGEGFEETLA